MSADGMGVEPGAQSAVCGYMNDWAEEGETALEMARRHVREGEARIRYQATLIGEIRSHGGNTDLSEQLLEEYRKFLRLARTHLKHEEDAEAWRNR